jgi:twitching motility protein PilI
LVADLGQFLGDSVPLNTDRPEVSVIAVEDQDLMLGLAVDRIVDMEWLNLEEMQMPQNVPDSVAPFLRGEWVLENQASKYLRLLDQIAILRSARWAA